MKLDNQAGKDAFSMMDDLIRSQEAEKSHISRLLSENINQILSTARLYVEQAIRQDETQNKFLNNSKKLISDAINELSKIAEGMMPSLFTELGLMAAINHLVNHLNISHPIKFSIEWSGFNEHKLNHQLQITIIRILQAKLHLITQNESTATVKIQVNQSEKILQLLVEDDGLIAEKLADDEKNSFYQLHNRIAILNGTRTITTHEVRGIRAEIVFPLHDS